MTSALTIEQCEQLSANFEAAFPNFAFIITTNQIWSTSGYEGNMLVNHLGLRIIKMNKRPNAPNITEDELKEKCFMWVYDSKGVKDAGERRDLLKGKLQ